jgi:hypothetical protein
MTRLLLLLPALALAACAAPEGGPRLRGLIGQHQPLAPAPLPPQVVAALPVGVPATVVTRNADGCYLVTLERTDPPSGFPLTDAAGNPVCEVAAPMDGTAVAEAEGAGPDSMAPDFAEPDPA